MKSRAVRLKPRRSARGPHPQKRASVRIGARSKSATSRDRNLGAEPASFAHEPHSQGKPGRSRVTRLTREESQALTRSRLLASAREVVAREGYENASIDLIAENAGYSKGAFYSNFDSKEAIFLELLETHASEDVPAIARLLDGVNAPLQMIDIISDWAASRSRDASWGVLALELMRRARLEETFGARHTHLFNAQYEGLGRILLRMFPEGAAPATPEVLGGLVFELTYGSSSAFTNRPGVSTLVKVTLTALYTAYGKR